MCEYPFAARNPLFPDLVIAADAVLADCDFFGTQSPAGVAADHTETAAPGGSGRLLYANYKQLMTKKAIFNFFIELICVFGLRLQP